MSIRLMSLVWEITWPTQSQLLVALKLADYANDDGSSIYPARASVARQAQCSESTVKNTLRAFRDAGLLIVVQEGGSGPKSPTVYAFNIDMLRALADAKATITGGADRLEIPDQVYPQALDNKGSTVDPLVSTRGQSGPAKGSTEAAKGSKALTPTHQYKTTNIDSPRAKAREGSNLNLEGKVERANAPRFQIKRGDASWRNWVESLSQPDAEKAEAAGELFATAKWASNGELLFIPHTGGLSEQSKRMQGD